jgi:hypothetical protein
VAERILQIMQTGELFVYRSDDLIGIASLFGVFKETGAKKRFSILPSQTFGLRDRSDLLNKEL